MSHYNLPHKHGQSIDRVLENMPTTESFQEVSILFQQLGDGSRLRILWLLCHCEECVTNIAAALNMSKPAVSHHLRTLKDNKLIESRREGKEVYYKIASTNQAHFLHEAIDAMFEMSCPIE